MLVTMEKYSVKQKLRESVYMCVYTLTSHEKEKYFNSADGLNFNLSPIFYQCC